MRGPSYCDGPPCTVHKLHRFIMRLPADALEEADHSYVIACGKAHAEEAAEVEGGPGAVIVEEAEGVDDDPLAACPFCPNGEPEDDEAE